MIHPTAIIDPLAELGDSVEIGPWVVLEGRVVLGDRCRVEAGAQLLGEITVGPDTVIGRAAILGGEPQDLQFDPATPSGIRLGARNRIREHVTIHRSATAGAATVVGDDNYLMVGAHLGHDSAVGSGNVIANGCLVAGHVTIGDHCFLGGGAVFHQFIRLGDHCMVQGNGSFSKDIPPYCAALRINRIAGLNTVGLRRAGYSAPLRSELKQLFDQLFRSGLNLSQAVDAAGKEAWSPEPSRLLAFVRNPSRKGVCTLG